MPRGSCGPTVRSGSRAPALTRRLATPRERESRYLKHRLSGSWTRGQLEKSLEKATCLGPLPHPQWSRCSSRGLGCERWPRAAGFRVRWPVRGSGAPHADTGTPQGASHIPGLFGTKSGALCPETWRLADVPSHVADVGASRPGLLVTCAH